MTVHTQVPIVLLGTSNLGPTPLYTHHTLASQRALVTTFAAHGHARIDTARLYGVTDEHGPGGSERALREVGLFDLEVDTKILMGSHAGDRIRQSLEASLKDLGLEKVNVFYSHGPDRETPLLHLVTEMNKLHKEGKFNQFGLSNYNSKEVAEICDIAREHSLLAPTVYQGNYSALARRAEDDLFPVLRKEKIAFYAYSPLAMGLLSGKGKDSPETAAAKEGSRFHEDSRKASVFKGTWFKPGIFAAVKHLNELTPHPLSLSLRWLAHHSALDAALNDGIILGASSPEQLEAALEVLGGGPLTAEEVQGFERMWELVGDDAPEASH